MPDARQIDMAQHFPLLEDDREPDNTFGELAISAYLHCGKCLDERPDGVSAQEYARVQAGWTREGLQVWCVRHNCNILHIDFMGQKVTLVDTEDADA